MSEPVDVAVIGGGPAGLAAATVAAEAGLGVSLFDEQAAPGGQIYRAIEAADARGQAWLDLVGSDYATGAAIVERFRQSWAVHHPGHAVFDIGPDGGLGVLADGAARWLMARRIVIATGAQERPVPVPGWTLPGVLGAGAAQAMLKSAAIVPAGRTVLAGSGPLLFLVARQLKEAGANVVAVLETTPAANYRRAAARMSWSVLSAPEIGKGWRWRRQVQREAEAYHPGVHDLCIEGTDGVEAISFKVGGNDHRIDCDLVLLHEGVVPGIHLSMAAGIAHEWDEVQWCWRPAADEYGRTDLERVLVAGDAAGIIGAELSAAAGTLVGLAAASDLGAISGEQAASQGAPSLDVIARKKPLRHFLDTLYQPRKEVLVPPGDETVVCHCEEVTAGELRRIAAMGCPGPNQAKAFTRCGMGPCQGRMCGLTTSSVLAAAQGIGVAEAGHLRIRPPVKPVTVGELAAINGLGEPPEGPPLLPTKPEEEAAT